MPVMVVGVENVVGGAAARLLRSRGGEVRAFVRAPDPTNPSDTGGDPAPWRELGCKVAHGFLDDEAHVESALEQVHTLALLSGRPTDDPETHVEHAATAIGAAIGAGCRRLVVLSDLAVLEPSGNPWLEALVEIEELARDAPMESVVLRSAVVYGQGDALTAAIAAGALGQDPPGSHWPVRADEVAMAAVLADAERDLDSALHVVLDVAGPSRVTTVELAERLARVVPVAPGDPLPDHAVELLTRDVPRPEGALGDAGAPLETFVPATDVTPF